MSVDNNGSQKFPTILLFLKFSSLEIDTAIFLYILTHIYMNGWNSAKHLHTFSINLVSVIDTVPSVMVALIKKARRE